MHWMLCAQQVTWRNRCAQGLPLLSSGFNEIGVSRQVRQVGVGEANQVRRT
jgi:hypothetical protein